MKTISLETKCGLITGIEKNKCNAFLGIPFARANRFEYAEPVAYWEGNLDATKFGNACPQYRSVNEHLDNPERAFYYREYRNGLVFNYDDDCLNLNIYSPKTPGKYPVIVFIYGGGFDSGANSEQPFDGEEFCAKGIVVAEINYRVGILGYISLPEIQEQFGRNGNFGLDDQITGIRWVKNNIEAFYGDSENITIMGQSAGAISIQYLCLNHQHERLFQRAIMISGGGKFPNFALPKLPEETEPYWKDFMTYADISSFSQLKTMDWRNLMEKYDSFRSIRNDNIYNTMPVIDGKLLSAPVNKLIKNPLKLDYLIGYTNNDMYAPALAFIGHRFIKQNGGYLYFFDIDAKGDKNKAFHSSDLRYIFNHLEESWRPYDDSDKKVADLMQVYLANFARCGNPNETINSEIELPFWKKTGHRALHFGKKIKMTFCPYLRLLINWLKIGNPV